MTVFNLLLWSDQFMLKIYLAGLTHLKLCLWIRWSNSNQFFSVDSTLLFTSLRFKPFSNLLSIHRIVLLRNYIVFAHFENCVVKDHEWILKYRHVMSRGRGEKGQFQRPLNGHFDLQTKVHSWGFIREGFVKIVWYVPMNKHGWQTGCNLCFNRLKKDQSFL